MAPTKQMPTESARALGAGLTFAVTVALFALGGFWLDGKLATSPLFVLLGTLLGILGGTIHVLRVLAPATLASLRTRRKAGDSGAGRADGRTQDRDPIE